MNHLELPFRVLSNHRQRRVPSARRRLLPVHTLLASLCRFSLSCCIWSLLLVLDALGMNAGYLAEKTGALEELEFELDVQDDCEGSFGGLCDLFPCAGAVLGVHYDEALEVVNAFPQRRVELEYFYGCLVFTLRKLFRGLVHFDLVVVRLQDGPSAH